MLTYARAFLISRPSLEMETAALRQQLAVYKRKQPRRINSNRLFWVVVRRVWNNWSEALVLVKPDTVVSWHHAGYRLFWRWRSCRSNSRERRKIPSRGNVDRTACLGATRDADKSA